jgi:hypothetical protein
LNEKIDAQKLISLYHTVFNSYEGKIVLTDLEATHFIHAPTTSDFDEGERRVVLRVKQMLATDPEKIIQRKEGEANHV